MAGTHSVEEFDLIWPIGFGEKDNFLDRLQLLSLCPEEKMVNSPRSWLTAHGKAKWLKFSPVSFISSDPKALISFMQEHGGRWVLKPNAGSFGRNIHFFDTSETGIRTIQRICSAEKEFFILQRYLPEILEGETRCLYANGSIIGSYLKLPQKTPMLMLPSSDDQQNLDNSRSRKGPFYDIQRAEGFTNRVRRNRSCQRHSHGS